MSYIHTDGVKYSDDKKTLVRCPGEVPFVAHNKAFDENCLKAVHG